MRYKNTKINYMRVLSSVNNLLLIGVIILMIHIYNHELLE